MERAELDKRKSEAEQPEREAKERHEKAWEGKQSSYVKLLASTFLFPAAKSLNGQLLHPELSFPGSFVPSNFHSLGTLVPPGNSRSRMQRTWNVCTFVLVL